MHLKRLLAAALVFAFTAACPGPSMLPDGGSIESSYGRLSGEIGPEGGELVAPEDSPLFGVRLKVAPGAVSTKTMFTVDPTVEATQLSGNAEQVGLQVVVGPADVTFASPLELTLPLEASMVSMYGQTAEDCKVWHLTEGGWKRLERTRGTENTVTVQLPAPGVAAAGVLAGTSSSVCLIRPTLCKPDKVKPIVVGNSCDSPSGYCLVKLAAPRFEPLAVNPGFTVVNRKLYYAHSPGPDRITVARYDLATGENILYGVLTVSGFTLVANTPVAVEADGTAWLGLKSLGNARFRENQPAFRFDTTQRSGEGMVISGSRVFRSFLNANSELQFAEDTNVSPAPVLRTTTYRLKPRPAVSGGQFLGLNNGAVRQFSFGGTTANEPFEASFEGFTDTVGSFVNSGVAAAVRGVNADAVLWSTVANGVQRFDSVDSFVAFDADDLLYGTFTNSPELHIFEPTGGFAVLPLTDAASTTLESQALRPRALVGVPGRRELVYIATGTAGSVARRDFYLIQKAD